MAGQGIIGALERRIPDALRGDLDTRRRSILALVIAAAYAGLCVPLAVIIFFVANPDDRLLGTTNTLLTGVLAGLTVPLLRRGGLAWAVNWLALLLFVGTAFAMWFGGGLFSPFILILPVIPAMTAIIGGRLSGVVWAALCTATVLIFQFFGDPTQMVHDLLRVQEPTILASASAIVTIVVLTLFVILSESTKREAIVQIAVATQRLAEAVRDEQRARDLAAEAVAANAVKTAFLATMSHELRTPLNVILGYSEMAIEDLQERGDDKLAEDLHRVHGAGQHLLGLISDVLDLSRIETERLVTDREALDLGHLLAQLAVSQHAAAERSATRLIVHPGADLLVHGLDPVRVRQIVGSLLGNAIKFTRRGEVHLRAKRTATGVEIVIQDTGIGIAPDKLELIFLPFTQVDPSPTRRYEGTGLGLAVARRLSEVMGGTLTVLSTPGRGSTFTVRLPCTSAPM